MERDHVWRQGSTIATVCIADCEGVVKSVQNKLCDGVKMNNNYLRSGQMRERRWTLCFEAYQYTDSLPFHLSFALVVNAGPERSREK